MTLTKILRYKIKSGTESSYIEMQENVQKIYREHAEVDFSYLKDPQDSTLKVEVIRFFDSNSDEVIKIIDSDPNGAKLSNH